MDKTITTPRNRKITIILLALCGLLALVAVIVGVDDNFPGVLMAFLSAVALVVAFVHPWRTAKKFLFLLLAAVLGFVLFIILNVVLDNLANQPGTTPAIQALLDGQAMNIFSTVFAMVCSAAFIIGAVGSVAMFIRKRRQAL